MEKNEFIHLIKKYLAGTASKEEQELLHRYYESFQREERHLRLDDEIEKRLLDKLQVHALGDESARVEEESHRDKSMPRLAISVAAAVMLVLAGVIYLMPPRKTNELRTDQWVEISTNRGQRKSIKLPDGTLVHLNAESVLKYPKLFDASKRTVSLEGEAFLDVETHANWPFLVETKQVVIQVLGTKFNVRAYADEEFMEATLVEGSINVNIPHLNQSLKLKPSQKLVVHDAELRPIVQQEPDGRSNGKLPSAAIPPIRTEHTDAVDETAWTEDVLSFTERPFADVAKALTRWYDVDIVFGNEEVSRWRYTATLSAKDGVDQALEALSMSKRFNYRKEGKTIFITQ